MFLLGNKPKNKVCVGGVMVRSFCSETDALLGEEM